MFQNTRIVCSVIFVKVITKECLKAISNYFVSFTMFQIVEKCFFLPNKPTFFSTFYCFDVNYSITFWEPRNHTQTKVCWMKKCIKNYNFLLPTTSSETAHASYLKEVSLLNLSQSNMFHRMTFRWRTFPWNTFVISWAFI